MYEALHTLHHKKHNLHRFNPSSHEFSLSTTIFDNTNLKKQMFNHDLLQYIIKIEGWISFFFDLINEIIYTN